MPTIRPSREDDIPALTALYGHHVQHGTGTFEIDPPTQAEMASRRREVLMRGLPYLVAENGPQVLGFAYCNWFKPRPAYRFSAEDSVYLAPPAQGAGLGRALLAELMVHAQAMGLRKLIAVVGDSSNVASIGLHRSVGFTEVGVLKACGWKFDKWLDVVMMECQLGLGNQTPPPSALELA